MTREGKTERPPCFVCVCVCVCVGSCKEEVLKLFYDILKSNADILLSRAPVSSPPPRLILLAALII
jgi:hypothetical protein